MHIGINGLCFLPKQVGPCTYVHNVIKELARLQTGHRFTVFLPSAARPFFPAAPSIRYVFLPAPNLIVRIAVEQLLLPLIVLALGCRIVHSMSNVVPLLLGRRNILTVHDIYFKHDPRRFKFWKRTYLQFLVPLSVKASRLIISVSKTTANDLMHFYRTPAEKIVVIYEGYKSITADASAKVADVKQRHGLTDPYFLFVGTIEPGKNLKNLISGFKPFADRFQLMIAGKWWVRYKELFQHAEELGLKGRVIFAGYVPDSDLAVLYKNAVALCMPSFHEGFGLPIVEAMSQGCPVVCSNTSCMPEVAGDAALYFDPHNVKQIEAALARVQVPAVRAELIRRAPENLKQFTWPQCAGQTHQVYDALAQGLSARQALSQA
jgi:glycosyltransferase involved in cell wall biosynthesis